MVVVVTLSLLPLFVSPYQSFAQNYQCNGLEATIVSGTQSLTMTVIKNGVDTPISFTITK